MAELYMPFFFCMCESRGVGERGANARESKSALMGMECLHMSYKGIKMASEGEWLFASENHQTINSFSYKIKKVQS